MILLESILEVILYDINLILILISLGIFTLNVVVVLLLVKIKSLLYQLLIKVFPFFSCVISSHRILKYSCLAFVILFFPIRIYIINHDYKPFFPFLIFWICANFIGVFAFSIVLNTKWKFIVWWEKIVFVLWLLIFLPIFSFLMAWLIILPSPEIN